jgi:hypothetical protein
VRSFALVALLVSCSFHDGALRPLGDGGGSDGGSGSGTPDGPSGPDACTMHALPPSTNVDATAWSAAFLTAPTWTCDQSGTTTIDATAGTATSTTCALGTVQISNDVAQTTAGGTVLVVRLQGLTISNGHVLRLVGNKPVVLLVAGDVVVDSGGLIDAGAKGSTPGAGGSLGCDTSNGLGGSPSGAGWGAGGGGHGTAGGVGCYNVDNGGVVSGSAMLTPLRGGCSGGVGGGPAGGAGGGAFEISASGTITVGASSAANLSAAGGGAPGGTGGGGNGGGAGGAILLVAPTMPTLGANGGLRAHGGAGSEGCSSCTALDAGGDGHATDNTRALDASGTAGGGNGNDHGRRGGLASIVGNGSLSAAAGEMTSAQTGGRGGGGGGGGRLVLTTGTATTSCD